MQWSLYQTKHLDKKKSAKEPKKTNQRIKNMKWHGKSLFLWWHFIPLRPIYIYIYRSLFSFLSHEPVVLIHLFFINPDHLAHGNFKRFSYLASDVGYIPRKMFLRLEDFGSHMNDFGIGLNQIGMEKFLDRIIGPKSSEKPRGRDSELNDIKTKVSGTINRIDCLFFFQLP